MSRTKNLIDATSESWRERIATLSDELATAERDHRRAIAEMEQAAAKVAAGVGGAGKDLAASRKRAEELAETIAARRDVLRAAQRSLTDAQKAEADDAAAAHARHCENLATDCTAAAEALERAGTAFDTAAEKYKKAAIEYGLATGAGRDPAHPHHRQKIDVSLRGWIVQNVRSAQFPGCLDSSAKRSGLVKPAAEFL